MVVDCLRSEVDNDRIRPLTRLRSLDDMIVVKSAREKKVLSISEIAHPLPHPVLLDVLAENLIFEQFKSNGSAVMLTTLQITDRLQTNQGFCL